MGAEGGRNYRVVMMGTDQQALNFGKELVSALSVSYLRKHRSRAEA